MKFEWDEKKNAINIKKHGISFVSALKVFQINYYTYESKNPGNDAKRFIAVGEVNKMIFAVVYTKRGDVIRIISARRARNEEKRKYSSVYGRRS